MGNIYGKKTNLDQPQQKYGIETLAVHAGARPKPVTGARNTPIYQTTAYAFEDVDNAADPKSIDGLNLLSAKVSQFGNTTEAANY
jgi:O-acetylhomoserine (thiol)-lyase